MPYPPEPWSLAGRMHVSAFLVPLADVPVDLPPQWVPIRVGRRGFVGVAWVSYEEPGELTYAEVMATLLVRRGWRVMPTIVRIWVDSEASRDGGRALWGIPKQLATFAFGSGTFRADGIARGTVRARVRLPGRWPVAFRIVQRLDGVAKISPVRARARVVLETSTFVPEPSGPLGFLTGRRPLVGFGLHDFRMRFGRAGAAPAKGVEWAR